MHNVVLITAKSKQEAQKIARKLLSQKLIACANIVPGIQSLFWWKGKVDSAKEVLLILKTRKAHFKNIVATVKEAHSYDVPEIIALPITQGYNPYLQWLNESTRKGN